MAVSDAVQPGITNAVGTQVHPYFRRNLAFDTHRDSAGRPRLAAFTIQECTCECEE